MEKNEKETVYSVFFCAKILCNVLKYSGMKDTLHKVNEGVILSYKLPVDNALQYLIPVPYWTKEDESLMLLYKEMDYEIKTNKNKEQVDSKLKKLEQIAQELRNLRNDWYDVQALRAYWYVLSGEFESALKSYEEIINDIFYVGTSRTLVENVFYCALTLAAIMKDRPFLKKIKHRGVVFGFFGKPYTNFENSQYSNANKESRVKYFEVEDFEVKQWASKFYKMFPKDRFFVSENELPIPPEVFGAEMHSDFSDEIDLKNLDKIITIAGKKYTQLVLFAEKKKWDYVKKLLEAGADVNKLSSSGESVLFFAIQEMNPTEFPASMNIDFFNTVSQHHHSKETLESQLNRFKYSILGCAVETGNPEIVNKVIEMMRSVKANVDIKYGGDKSTPLYQVIHQYWLFSKKTNIDNVEMTDVHFEYMRRTNPYYAGLTLKETKQRYQQYMQIPEYRDYQNLLKKLFNEKIQKHWTTNNLLEIVRLLLDAGSNPNEPHTLDERLRNYTPLMLAAEDNWLEAFDLMVKKGGDVEQKTQYYDGRKSCDASCWEIALNWKSDKIIKYLQEHFGEQKGIIIP